MHRRLNTPLDNPLPECEKLCMTLKHTDDFLREVLMNARTIAVVGASMKSDRAGHTVPKFLQSKGWRVIPVNPGHADGTIWDEACYATLADVPEKIDMVLVFRKAEDTPPIAEEAVAIGAKTLWLQLGIENAETARIAAKSGLKVVMDRCALVDVTRLGLSQPTPHL